MLIQHRADIDSVDEDGDNALAWAVMKQNANMVEALVQHGSSLSQSLLEEESPLAAVVHPELLSRIAPALEPLVVESIRDVSSSPPIWVLVQFCSAEAVRSALRLQQDSAAESGAVEALLRRRVQAGYLRQPAPEDAACKDLQTVGEPVVAAGSCPEIEEIEAELRRCVPVDGWASLVAGAATRQLRREVEGAIEGSFDVDLNFVEALLQTWGADPNLRVEADELPEEDDDIDDEDDEEGLGTDRSQDSEGTATSWDRSSYEDEPSSSQGY